MQPRENNDGITIQDILYTKIYDALIEYSKKDITQDDSYYPDFNKNMCIQTDIMPSCIEDMQTKHIEYLEDQNKDDFSLNMDAYTIVDNIKNNTCDVLKEKDINDKEKNKMVYRYITWFSNTDYSNVYDDNYCDVFIDEQGIKNKYYLNDKSKEYKTDEESKKAEDEMLQYVSINQLKQVKRFENQDKGCSISQLYYHINKRISKEPRQIVSSEEVKERIDENIAKSKNSWKH
ncbi:hypothetical protein WA158_007573 [Blastocystis sp. Blastoise]